MSARTSQPNVRYETKGHTKHAGKLIETRAAGANVSDLVVGKLLIGRSVTNSQIAHVLRVIAQIKVIRIYAKRVIASVKNPLAFRNLPSVDNPRRTVRFVFLKAKHDHSPSVGRPSVLSGCPCCPDPFPTTAQRIEPPFAIKLLLAALGILGFGLLTLGRVAAAMIPTLIMSLAPTAAELGAFAVIDFTGIHSLIIRCGQDIRK